MSDVTQFLIRTIFRSNFNKTKKFYRQNTAVKIELASKFEDISIPVFNPLKTINKIAVYLQGIGLL
jgi:hypothetical protein